MKPGGESNQNPLPDRRTGHVLNVSGVCYSGSLKRMARSKLLILPNSIHPGSLSLKRPDCRSIELIPPPRSDDSIPARPKSCPRGKVVASKRIIATGLVGIYSRQLLRCSQCQPRSCKRTANEARRANAQQTRDARTPSGAHGATNSEEHQGVCARRRVSRRRTLWGHVEDFVEPRTKLAAFFSSLLEDFSILLRVHPRLVAKAERRTIGIAGVVEIDSIVPADGFHRRFKGNGLGV